MINTYYCLIFFKDVLYMLFSLILKCMILEFIYLNSLLLKNENF